MLLSDRTNAIALGLIVVLKGQTTLPLYSYIVALLLGCMLMSFHQFPLFTRILLALVAPFSQTLFARMGNGIGTNQLMKMIGGAIVPGRPVANLYVCPWTKVFTVFELLTIFQFTMWSHDIVNQSIGLASDLKVGQYLKVPPRVMFLTQLWGTILGMDNQCIYVESHLTVGTGVIVNYGRYLRRWFIGTYSRASSMTVVMVSVVTSQKDILLSPTGTNVWSGQVTQSSNSDAVTWSLAKELYGPGGSYFIVPLSLLIGVGTTVVQWLIGRVRYPVAILNVAENAVEMAKDWASQG